MKTLLLLLPALASCLSPSRPGRNFIQACRNLHLSPDDGILSGICDAKGLGAGVDTRVELDGCLA